MRSLPAIAATLLISIAPASAQEVNPQAMLDRLHSAPRPDGQKDLDTRALASAQRAKADSVTERTNGLWQSWVVAICQGCGVKERQYAAEDDRALEDRAGWRSPANARKEPHSSKAAASRIIIRPFAMREEGMPALSLERTSVV